MSINHLKIKGHVPGLMAEGITYFECKPIAKTTACVPQDEFDCVQRCKLCNKYF